MRPQLLLQSAPSKVLIVEDEALIAESLSSMLTSLGYEVTGIADSCEETLASIDSIRPDCILMDIRIRGEIDGIETTARIRERLDIPVIYLTCQTDPATIDRAKMTMASGFLLKSAHRVMLSASIDMAILKHNAEQKLREGKFELERLRQSEQQLRALVGGNNEYSLRMLDQHGSVRDWPDRTANIEGYNAEEHFGDIILPLLYG